MTFHSWYLGNYRHTQTHRLTQNTCIDAIDGLKTFRWMPWKWEQKLFFEDMDEPDLGRSIILNVDVGPGVETNQESDTNTETLRPRKSWMLLPEKSHLSPTCTLIVVTACLGLSNPVREGDVMDQNFELWTIAFIHVISVRNSFVPLFYLCFIPSPYVLSEWFLSESCNTCVHEWVLVQSSKVG